MVSLVCFLLSVNQSREINNLADELIRLARFVVANAITSECSTDAAARPPGF